MSGRLDIIKPLVDHFKADGTLTFTGSGQYIFVMSNYEGVSENNQYSPAIWIIPLDTGPSVKAPRDSDCKTRMTLQLFVGVAVYNTRDTRGNYGWNSSQASSTYMGAYPEAVGYEMLVRESILEFNKKTLATRMLTYGALALVNLPKPDVHNGHLILPQIYETEFTF